MSQVKQEQNFTLEELPKVLYQKLDGILAGTQYQSLSSLAGSSHEQIVLISKGFDEPSIWIDINDGSEEGKPNGTMDIYHVTTVDGNDETRLPHLRVFVDILFGELKIRYLQQPQVTGFYKPNKEKLGELDAYFYTLGWFITLEGRECRQLVTFQK